VEREAAVISAPIRFHLADVTDLSGFPARAFDVILSQVVLPHIARKDRALEECSRLLRRGGIFMHDLDRIDAAAIEPGREDLPRFAIRRGARTQSTTTYLRKHGVALLRGSTNPAGVADILAIHERTAEPVSLGLDLDEMETIVLRSLPRRADGQQPWGVRSVFRAGPGSRRTIRP
jgi:SAM-dependent methyltransferase